MPNNRMYSKSSNATNFKYSMRPPKGESVTGNMIAELAGDRPYKITMNKRPTKIIIEQL